MSKNENSLLPLFNEVFSQQEVYVIQEQLLVLLGSVTEKYTMGDSSSVPVEVAQELFESICYCINLYLSKLDISERNSVLKNNNIEKIFHLSLVNIENKINSGKEQLKKVEPELLKIDNSACQMVPLQIELFFKKYDCRFFAQKNNCFIDYPLIRPTKESKGIAYINSYLDKFLIENDFLKNFETNNINKLLKAYNEDSKNILVNIYELVCVNAIGLAILDLDIKTLYLSKNHRDKLEDSLTNLSKVRTFELINRACDKICNHLNIENSESKIYLKSAPYRLYDRIKLALQNNNIEKVFISFDNIKCKSNKNQYVDNDTMTDKKLRDLIDEISSCRFVSDKISIIKENVHSLRDLIEILNIGIRTEECLDLFRALDIETIAVLLNYVHAKYEKNPNWSTETDWQTQLKLYFKKLNSAEKYNIMIVLNRLKF